MPLDGLCMSQTERVPSARPMSRRERFVPPLVPVTAKQGFCHRFPTALQKHRSGREVPSCPLGSETQLQPGYVATSLASAVLRTADPSAICHGMGPASRSASEVCFIVCCQLTALASDARPPRYRLGRFSETKNETSERRQRQFSLLNEDR